MQRLPEVRLEGACVEFPIYEGSSMSIRAAIMAPAVGALLNHELGRVIAVNALQEIDLDLRHGDRCALIGHNGAGKSTLLRLIAGVYAPTQGRVRVSGQVTTILDIAGGMDLEASGLENVYIRGMHLGIARRTIDRHVEDIVDFTELGEYVRLPVKSYSEGMRLRLAFGICTSFPAEILLLDETIGVGDARFFDKAQLRLETLVESSAIMVMASHGLETLRRFCDKGIWLEHGAIRMFGEIEGVLDAYQKGAAVSPDTAE